jgi:hypothetical protein
MKKIFTLLFTTAMLSTAFAQYGQKGQGNRGNDKSNDVYVSNNNRGHGHDDYGGRGGYIFTAREKNMQIDQINHEYEHKIRDVKSRNFMGWYQKKRIINNLEAQRDQEIQAVLYRFNSPKNKFGDDYRGNRGNRW